jgi:hypothetical protein
MSPSASPAGLPDGSAKCATTLSPRRSKPVRRWPVTTASAPSRSWIAASRILCSSPREN